MTALSVSLPLKVITLQAWGSPLQQGCQEGRPFFLSWLSQCLWGTSGQQADKWCFLTTSRWFLLEAQQGHVAQHFRGRPRTTAQQLSLDSSGASFFWGFKASPRWTTGNLLQVAMMLTGEDPPNINTEALASAEIAERRWIRPQLAANDSKHHSLCQEHLFPHSPLSYSILLQGSSCKSQDLFFWIV